MNAPGWGRVLPIVLLCRASRAAEMVPDAGQCAGSDGACAAPTGGSVDAVHG